jgi:hypothetical protein
MAVALWKLSQWPRRSEGVNWVGLRLSVRPETGIQPPRTPTEGEPTYRRERAAVSLNKRHEPSTCRDGPTTAPADNAANMIDVTNGFGAEGLK